MQTPACKPLLINNLPTQKSDHRNSIDSFQFVLKAVFCSSNEQKTVTNIVEYDPNNISVFRLGSYTEDAPHPGNLLIRFINE